MSEERWEIVWVILLMGALTLFLIIGDYFTSNTVQAPDSCQQNVDCKTGYYGDDDYLITPEM